MRRQKLYFNQLLPLFNRYSARLRRLVAAGRNLRKQGILRKRLQNMHGTLLGLQKSIRMASAAGAMAGSLVFFQPQTADAQVFTQQTGANNPLNGIDAGTNSTPAFVDIDGDGDKDLFIGEYYGTVLFYKNTGTVSAPSFVGQNGTSNPLSGVTSTPNGYTSAPAFADIDNDGDMDVFIGRWDGTITYYKNTGTPLAPVFVQQTGAPNPLNIVNAGNFSTPAFVDIDGDGDKDVFIGNENGIFYYYKNTGSASAPVFTSQTGASNPLNGVDVGTFSAPSFVDVDGDGDMDAFFGEESGIFLYYKNTGTASAPVFTAQPGASNPFNGVDIGSYSTPAFADIDADGDKDAFIGELDGNIFYFKNTQAASCIDPTSGGAIAAAQTMCNGIIPAAFTSPAPASGQTGTLEYKWQSSTSGASSGFGDIGSTNSETYAPGSLTLTTWFKRLARVTCMGNWTGAAESNVLQITVRAVFSTGSIQTAGGTICHNGDPAIINSSAAASGGDGNITYRWQSSLTADFASPTVISSNTATYDPPAGLTATTWYRRQAKDGTCNPAFTTSAGVWQVTVRPVFTAGTISSAGETICYNGDPALIGSSADAGGGDENITCQWQSSLTADFASPTVIGSNTATYDPPAGLTATTWYRRQAKDGTCNLAFTTSAGVWQVTVRPVFTAGTISATGETICYNGDPALIGSSADAGGGDENITSQWQSSLTADFASPTVIGSNTATYDPPAGLTATTWYRRQAKDGTCNLAFTTSAGVWQVAVHPEFVVGSVSTSQAICSGNTSTQLRGIAPTGGNAPYAYQWQSSTDNVSFSDISDATALDYQPGILTQTMYYLQKQTSASDCGTLTTNTVIITVKPVLTASVTIEASANPVVEGTTVTFTATPENGGSAPAYQWYLGAVPVGSGGETYSYIPADGDTISVVMTSNATPCLAGSPATSNTIGMTVTGMAAIITVTGNVGTGQTECYNATQTIIIAGVESAFTVSSEGIATMIAGHNIIYLPGTTVVPGGYMHGYITTDGIYCGQKSPSIPIVITGLKEPFMSLQASFFRMFPNPTAGKITLEQTGDFENGIVRVEIYTMRGEKMMDLELAGERKHEYNLAGLSAGLYFVKIMAGENSRTVKFVKTF